MSEKEQYEAFRRSLNIATLQQWKADLQKILDDSEAEIIDQHNEAQRLWATFLAQLNH